MRHNLTVLCSRSVAKRKFQPVDLSTLVRQPRNVLELTFSELLDLFFQAKQGKWPELRAFRVRKWREQFRSLFAWHLTPA